MKCFIFLGEKDEILHNAQCYGQNLDSKEICPKHRLLHLGPKRIERKDQACVLHPTTLASKGRKTVSFEEARALHETHNEHIFVGQKVCYSCWNDRKPLVDALLKTKAAGMYN